jgi:hypothetical protein
LSGVDRSTLRGIRRVQPLRGRGGRCASLECLRGAGRRNVAGRQALGSAIDDPVHGARRRGQGSSRHRRSRCRRRRRGAHPRVARRGHRGQAGGDAGAPGAPWPWSTAAQALPWARDGARWAAAALAQQVTFMGNDSAVVAFDDKPAAANAGVILPAL